jgi:hypothetical protein
LSREEKENLQRELSSVPVILTNVANAQTRLRHSKNGDADANANDEYAIKNARRSRSTTKRRSAKARPPKEVVISE